MPDRLPSLLVLIGFWIPPAVGGWMAGAAAGRIDERLQPGSIYAMLAGIVVAWAALWFMFNARRMPPYVPGSTMDPTFVSPEAVAWLAAFTALIILPASALACALAFRRRRRRFRTSERKRG